MLEVIASSLIGLLTEILGKNSIPVPELQLVSWQNAEIFVLPTEPDPLVDKVIKAYLQDLSKRGINPNEQGVWIQSDWVDFAQNRGNIPASAASLTKIATSLAALEKWGANYQFETRIYTTGIIQNGVLKGDLIVEGGGDPLFVWEEAIALGNSINKLGIRKITGNLLIKGNFKMNFASSSLVSGQMLLQGMNTPYWSAFILRQYQTLKPGTPKPQLAIAGQIMVKEALPPEANLLLRHQSLTLLEILKQMNIYSNNAIAEMLAQSVGGAKIVSEIVAQAANIPPQEIQLVNGSGLGVDNRISPRAVCAMLIAIERHFHSQPLHVTDLFPVGGRDKVGTMQHRQIPPGVAIKTGTLNQVSALAGVIPTKERGTVWFAIINSGSNIDQFRQQQDQVLQNLSKHWQLAPNALSSPQKISEYLGDPNRNFQVN